MVSGPGKSIRRRNQDGPLARCNQVRVIAPEGASAECSHVALYRYVAEIETVFELAIGGQKEAGYARMEA